MAEKDLYIENKIFGEVNVTLNAELVIYLTSDDRAYISERSQDFKYCQEGQKLVLSAKWTSILQIAHYLEQRFNQCAFPNNNSICDDQASLSVQLDTLTSIQLTAFYSPPSDDSSKLTQDKLSPRTGTPFTLESEASLETTSQQDSTENCKHRQEESIQREPHDHEQLPSSRSTSPNLHSDGSPPHLITQSSVEKDGCGLKPPVETFVNGSVAQHDLNLLDNATHEEHTKVDPDSKLTLQLIETNIDKPTEYNRNENTSPNSKTSENNTNNSIAEVPSQDISAVMSVGARPKILKNSNYSNKISFTVHQHHWLWLSAKIKHANLDLEFQEEISSEDLIEITVITYTANSKHFEKCTKRLAEMEKNKDERNYMISKVLPLPYTPQMELTSCPKDTFICDDGSDGVVIVGLREEDVQQVLSILDTYHGSEILENVENNTKPPKAKIHRQRKIAKPPEENLPGSLLHANSNDCLRSSVYYDSHGTNNETDKINQLKTIPMTSRLYMYIHSRRWGEVITLGDMGAVTITANKEKHEILLSGALPQVSQTTVEIERYITKIGETIVELIINIPPEIINVRNVIAETEKKYSDLLLDFIAGELKLIGPSDEIMQAHNGLQNILGVQLVLQPPKRKKRVLANKSANVSMNVFEGSFATTYGTNIHVIKADITKLFVGAVVNAANSNLQHGGGVAGAINKAAGPGLQSECNRRIKKGGPLDVCGVYSSQPYNMPCQCIIHVVGPKWKDYTDEKEASVALKLSILHCLAEADKQGVPSVALPAISAGIYGAPLEIVAKLMIKNTMEFISGCNGNTAVKDILLVDCNQDILELIMVNIKEVNDQGIMSGDLMTKGFERFTCSSFVQVCDTPSEGAQKGSPSWPKMNTKQEHATTESKSGILAQEMSSNVPSQKPQLQERVQVNSNASNSFQINNQSTFKIHHQTTSMQEVRSYVGNKEYYDTVADDDTGHDNDTCAICMDTPTHMVVLHVCQHVFCKDCIDKWLKVKPTCPNCGQVYGELQGDQPADGSMTVRRLRTSLPGYENCDGVIEITYAFPAGTQKEVHPNPGSKYKGINRKAFLPDSEEGKHVLSLLKRAFEARLTFTIGRSTTTGRDGQITWNDIHHKTNMYGGPQSFGYPDSTYITRVKSELAAKGIQ